MAKKKLQVQTDFNIAGDYSAKIVKMTDKTTRLSRAVAKTDKIITAGFTSMGKGALWVGKSAVKGLTAATTAAAGLGVALGALTVHTNKETVEMDALARSVKSNIGFMQSMDQVVKPMGFNFENVVDLMEEMNNKMGESTGLGKPMTAVAESVKILGLKYKALKKLSPEEQFIKIMDAAKGLKDHQKAVAAVDILMGGEANRIMGALRQQKGTMGDMLKTKLKMNFLDKEGTAGARDFSKSLGEVGFIADTVKKQFFGLVGQGLTPALKEITAYSMANKDLIKIKIRKYAKDLVRTLKDSAKWIAKNEDKIWDAVKSGKEFIKMSMKMAGILYDNKNAILGTVAALGTLKTTISTMDLAASMTKLGASSGASLGAGITSGAGKVIGASGWLQGALSAAFAGIAVGSLVQKHVIEPAVRKSDKNILSIGNRAAKMSTSVHRMSLEQLDKSAVEMARKRKDLTAAGVSPGTIGTMGMGVPGMGLISSVGASIAQLYAMGQSEDKRSAQASIQAVEAKIAARRQQLLSTGTTPVAQSAQQQTVVNKTFELTIKDDTGRAEITKGSGGEGIRLVSTGALP